MKIYVCEKIIDPSGFKFVYYQSIKRELKTRPIYECRCDERLKTKTEESTRLTYTGLLVELKHTSGSRMTGLGVALSLILTDI